MGPGRNKWKNVVRFFVIKYFLFKYSTSEGFNDFYSVTSNCWSFICTVFYRHLTHLMPLSHISCNFYCTQLKFFWDHLQPKEKRLAKFEPEILSFNWVMRRARNNGISGSLQALDTLETRLARRPFICFRQQLGGKHWAWENGCRCRGQSHSSLLILFCTVFNIAMHPSYQPCSKKNRHNYMHPGYVSTKF